MTSRASSSMPQMKVDLRRRSTGGPSRPLASTTGTPSDPYSGRNPVAQTIARVIPHTVLVMLAPFRAAPAGHPPVRCRDRRTQRAMPRSQESVPQAGLAR